MNAIFMLLSALSRFPKAASFFARWAKIEAIIPPIQQKRMLIRLAMKMPLALLSIAACRA